MGTVSGKGTTVKRKRYSRKFQRMAVGRMRTCEDVGELARELGVTRRCLYKWRTKLEMVEPGEEASRPSTHVASYRKEIQQLKRLLAEKTMEVDFFKGALQKIKARRQKHGASGETASTSRSAK
jgi:transposase-like protein